MSKVTFQLCEGIFTEAQDDRVKLINLEFRSGIWVSKEAYESLELFKKPCSREEYLSSVPDWGASVFQLLSSNQIILPTESMDLLAKGLVTPPSRPLGEPIELRHIGEVDDSVSSVVVGFPVDVGTTGAPGARFGPGLIRRHFPFHVDAKTERPVRIVDIDRRQEFDYEALGLVDLGDVVWEAGEGLDSVGARLKEVADRVLEQGLQLVVLGGDHSGTRWVLSSLIERGREFGVIHLDAHHDLYGLPNSRPSHSNALELALQSPSVLALRQIGLRGFHVEAAFREPVTNPKLSLVTAREARMSSTEELLKGLPRDIPYYVTIDIDCLDPVIAPETGTPLPGGLSLHLVEDLLHEIGAELEVLAVLGRDSQPPWGPDVSDCMAKNPEVQQVPFVECFECSSCD